MWALLFVAYTVSCWRMGPQALDDSYMFVRYADQILGGHGYSWNGADGPTYGCTSSVFTLVVTLGRALAPQVAPLDLVLYIGRFIGVLGLILLGMLLRRSAHPVLYWSALFWTATWPKYSYHTSTGMDTGLAWCAICILLLCCQRLRKSGTTMNTILCAFVAWFSFNVRPDSGIYAALLPVLFIWPKRDLILKFSCSFGLLLLLDTAIKWQYFGDPLPLPFYAKSTGMLEGYLGWYRWNPIKYAYILTLCLSPAIFWMTIGFRRDKWRWILVLGLPVFISVLYFFRVTQIMGENGRYYYPALPIFFLLAAQFPPPDKWFSPQVYKRGAGLLILGVLSLLVRTPAMNTWVKLTKPNDLLKGIEGAASEQSPLNLSWLEAKNAMVDLCQHLPDNSKIAASEHGEMAAVCPKIQIIDTTGLHNPNIAHSGFDMALLIEEHPDLIWLPHSDYSGQLKAVLTSPLFFESYHYYPSAYSYGIAIAKDKVELASIVAKQWAKLYPDQEMDMHLFHP